MRPNVQLRNFTALFALLVALLVAATATAQGSRSAQIQRGNATTTGASPRLDGWMLSFERGELESAYVCGELPTGGRWSVVGCGSGSGFLYRPRPAETDLAHFRTHYAAPLFVGGPTRAEIGPGFGVVELQRGPDRSGLRFAPGRGPQVREASGPEAAVEFELESTAGLGPFDSLHARWNAGVAWIPDAPAVVGSASETVTFSTVTLNGSF